MKLLCALLAVLVSWSILVKGVSVPNNVLNVSEKQNHNATALADSPSLHVTRFRWPNGMVVMNIPQFPLQLQIAVQDGAAADSDEYINFLTHFHSQLQERYSAPEDLAPRYAHDSLTDPEYLNRWRIKLDQGLRFRDPSPIKLVLTVLEMLIRMVRQFGVPKDMLARVVDHTTMSGLIFARFSVRVEILKLSEFGLSSAVLNATDEFSVSKRRDRTI